MVRLVAVVEQALVAGLAALVGSLIFQRVRVEVTDFQGTPRQCRQHDASSANSAQYPGAALRGLVEQNLAPVVRLRQRFAGKFAWLDLELQLDRLLEGRLQACHLGPERG